MAARLLVFTGKLRGKVFGLPPEGKVVIGRSQQSTMPLPDVNLSRKHCAIGASGQGYVLSDLQSTNGTFLNGTRITQVLLREGDRIVIGETELEFRVKERFDDNETKMDLMPVGTPEEITPEEALAMMSAAPMGGQDAAKTIPSAARPDAGAAEAVDAAPSELLSRVRFCEVCDVNIPRADVTSGAAREIDEHMLCAACIGRLKQKGAGGAVPAARLIEALRAEAQRE
jgi:predicted component of type VI protein secretion system